MSGLTAQESPVEAAVRLATRNRWAVVAVWPAAHLNDEGQPVAHTVICRTEHPRDEDAPFVVHIMHTLEKGFSHLAHGDYDLTLEGAQRLAILRAQEAR